MKYYRRSPFLVSYWKDNQLLFENYLTGKIVAASTETAAVLDCFNNWQTVEVLSRKWPKYTSNSLHTSVRLLTRETLLETANQKTSEGTERERALQKWSAWNPAAGFFHMSTKDAYSDEITAEEIRHIEALMESKAAALFPKKYQGTRVVKLPSEALSTEFSRVLRARQTWRKFSRGQVKREALATLLELSFGVQRWERIAKLGKLAHKTSPSGGSLHPLEAYVMARKVEGIAPGIYHYDSVRRGLQEVRRGATSKEVQQYLAGQWWFRDAAFLVFLTAVFGRTQWKYDYPRAYRAIQIEAGHLAQTFCLTATWLGLAPFCTIAMKDTAIEKALRVDGISESVIYAMGAGVKPENKQQV
jgi:SagB-type dehydrogenase family enzyme